MHGRHRQAQSGRQTHHEKLVDDRMRIVGIRVIGFQHVGGRGCILRLEQGITLQHQRQLVLRAGQRHALERPLRERHPRQPADTPLQRSMRQRPQAARHLSRHLRRYQRQ